MRERSPECEATTLKPLENGPRAGNIKLFLPVFDPTLTDLWILSAWHPAINRNERLARGPPRAVDPSDHGVPVCPERRPIWS